MSNIGTSISRFKKEKFILELSEDDFRDKIVRPLLLRMGFKDGRDLCGPNEQGKDSIFVTKSPLQLDEIYAVQTKKGKLGMSKDAKTNVIEACTQLKMAIQTKIRFLIQKNTKYPDKILFCSSGKINDKAKEYIVDEIKDNRILFMDSDDIINKIDELFPEVWYGIDAEIIPYFKAIKINVEELSTSDIASDFLSPKEAKDSANDDTYVSLKLNRTVLSTKKIKGKMVQVPKFEEFPVNGILNRKDKKILILGEGGSGKSTALRRLAYEIAKKSVSSFSYKLIPIIVRATEVSLKTETMSLVEICAQETKRLTNLSNPSFSINDLISGNVIIFIDALDEVSDDDNKIKILKLIEVFYQDYNTCKVIITSRDYTFISRLEYFKTYSKYKISPISFNEVDKILKRFEKKKSLEPEATKEFLRRIEQIHGMELSPLIVTVFAASSDYSKKDIPPNITELFKKFTEMMLGRWDQKKGLALQYQYGIKDFVLKKIAYEMHRLKITNVGLEQFKKVINDELADRGLSADIEILTDEIINRSGLFRIIHDKIEFKHHILQEFFAGRGMEEPNLKNVFYEDWWRRAIVFYFGENSDNSKQLLELIISYDDTKKELLFNAALTVGLSLQAAYMIKTKDKLDILFWVLSSIASSKNDFLEIINQHNKFPLSQFINYYIFGRDAVACNVICESIEGIKSKLINTNLNDDDKELLEFWLIVGLMESGNIENAHELVKHFNPKDSKLLLCIHLGAFIIHNLRVSNKEEFKYAEKILTHLEPKINPLRSLLLKEFKSELIEMRKGEIKEIQ